MTLSYNQTKIPKIQDILQILRPFETVTTELSAEKYVSASKIIPLARGLQRLMVKHTGIGWELAEKLSSQMTTRLGRQKCFGIGDSVSVVTRERT